MDDLIQPVTYSLMLRAAGAANTFRHLGSIELAVAEEFGARPDVAYLDLVNAVSRRMVALSYFLKGYRAVINRHNLTEYQLLSAAAVARLPFVDDGFDTDTFIALAKSLPESA